MGFKQDAAKKCCNVDGHEKPEQQRHCTKFISEYLTKIEPRCHRWIQLSNEEFDTVKEQLGPQLEYVCQQLGTKAIITTKYHAEFVVRVLSIPGDSQSHYIVGFL